MSDHRTPRFDALPMSYKDSTVIEVYYEFGEEILLKLNFDQNDSVTYREEAGHLPNNHAQQLQAYSDHSAS